MAQGKRILIIAATTERDYQRETLLGIREFAERRRWTLFVQMISRITQGKLSQWTVAGYPLDLSEFHSSDFAIHGTIVDLMDVGILRAIAKIPGPKVSYSDCLAHSPLPRVTMDNLQVGRLAARHFLERNVKHLGFFGADWKLHFALQRQAGFVRELEHTEAVVTSLSHAAVEEGEGREFRDWLERTPKPVGLWAADDYFARRIAQRCAGWDMDIPRDVLILGSNNDAFHCEFCIPSLSSVIMPSRAIGYKAAEMLDTLMRGQPLSRHELLIPSPGIVERTSTKATAFGCGELDRALRFIRENATQPIGVKQVVEHVAVSKRSLESLFSTHLGHGPGEELRCVRLALAKFYLTTTSRPIGQVAHLSGFSDAAHLGRVLQRHERQTPIEYRRRHASVGEGSAS
ncbi:MAG: substrate-binding domain-containing protein [Planctomycetota bacterium]|nr:substrate-binding domain-containing protein [Planctomycetota bacterium]